MNKDNKEGAHAFQLLRQLAALSRDKTDALLLIFSCTMVLLPFIEHSPMWINSFAGLLITWRVFITLRGKEMPEKWLLAIIVALLLSSVYLYFHTWLGKDVSVTILIGLVCLKMLEMRAKRDAVAVIFVCYFLLVGQLIYSQSLLSALYLLLCISLLISTQFAFQYHQLTPSFWKRLTDGFRIVGLGIPLALILFLLFPRLQTPLWGKQQGNITSVTGLSDTMEPGNVAELALSDQIAFRVKFSGPIPPAPQLYWRGIVLDLFNGKRWSENSPFSQQLTTTLTQGPFITQEIILEPHNQRWLFGLDHPTSMNNTSLPVDNENNINGHLTNNWEMRSNDPIQNRIRYFITSNFVTNLSLTHPLNNATSTTTLSNLFSENIEAKNKLLQLPREYNPLTLQWAEALRQKSTNKAQLVISVLRFFREQPFRYTLSPPPTGTNQIDDFMFRTQAGFCEHYASAFVVIMRAMGIPARVVTGYQGGEINPIDGLMTVRQADAHAWAEIWIEPYGWIRVDPTAAVSPDRIEHGFNSSFPNRHFSDLIIFAHQTWLSDLVKEIRLRWDATNSAWNLWVLNYNFNKQKDLLKTLIGIEHLQATQLGIAMMTVASIIVAGLSFFLLRKKSTQNSLDKLYDVFCHYMSEQGFPRIPYEGANDYSQRLQLFFPDKKELVEFLALYVKYKYSKEYNSDPDLNQLLTLKALLKLCLQLKPSVA